jgi:hypothetical protein
LVIVVLIGLMFFGLDRAAGIYYYRTINDYAISVGTTSGPNTWTRVTGVVETDTSVTVYVKSMSAPLPGTGDDVYELTVRLANPLGGRTVVDGGLGDSVPKLVQPSLN